MSEFYLDNAATTPCLKTSIDVMEKVLSMDYGNPSSLHGMGISAEQYLKEARSFFAQSIKAKEKEIIFTSGGTESNNLAILGAALANQRTGKHIITTPMEHPSVLEPILSLKDREYDISYTPLDENGRVRLDALSEMIEDDTVLVCVMYVNNETGIIQPIEEIGNIIRNKSESCLFFVDAVQAYGKLPINVRSTNISLLSASSHKVHGPKGCGFLYKKESVKLSPIVYGGGQEAGFRSGTENVPAIAAFYTSAKELISNMDAHQKHLLTLKEDFLENVLSIEDVFLNGSDGFGCAHIINISILDVSSEVMLHALEDKGIFVSSGSACSSHKKTKSATLSALSLSDARIESAIRISLSPFTQKEALDACYQAIKELAPVLRKYTRK